MTKDTSISMDQLEAILDNSPTTVIISALDNRELLYANKAAVRPVRPGRSGRRTAHSASSLIRGTAIPTGMSERILTGPAARHILNIFPISANKNCWNRN